MVYVYTGEIPEDWRRKIDWWYETSLYYYRFIHVYIMYTCAIIIHETRDVLLTCAFQITRISVSFSLTLFSCSIHLLLSTSNLMIYQCSKYMYVLHYDVTSHSYLILYRKDLRLSFQFFILEKCKVGLYANHTMMLFIIRINIFMYTMYVFTY